MTAVTAWQRFVFLSVFCVSVSSCEIKIKYKYECNKNKLNKNAVFTLTRNVNCDTLVRHNNKL